MGRRVDQDLAKERFWRRMIRRWRRSKLAIRAFCLQQQLSEPSFYSWRRIIAERDHQTSPPVTPATRVTRQRREPRITSARPARLPPFLPVQVVTASPSPSPIEVVLGNGRVIRLGSGFDPDLLRQLLAVVEEPSC